MKSLILLVPVFALLLGCSLFDLGENDLEQILDIRNQIMDLVEDEKVSDVLDLLSTLESILGDWSSVLIDDLVDEVESSVRDAEMDIDRISFLLDELVRQAKEHGIG